MKCPHCLIEIHPNIKRVGLDRDANGEWYIQISSCPSCSRNSLELINFKIVQNSQFTTHREQIISKKLIYPKGSNRNPVPVEVPSEFAKDYVEACLVLADSPMASSALSRRCLQNILRDKLKVKRGDLSKEIQEVIDRSLLPTDLLESIDAIRNIGNFAAHPTKNQSTGEIVEVEVGEAEWNLDVIELLFDFLFVRPEMVKRKKEALNKKLAEVGKPNMK